MFIQLEGEVKPRRRRTQGRKVCLIVCVCVCVCVCVSSIQKTSITERCSAARKIYYRVSGSRLVPAWRFSVRRAVTRSDEWAKSDQHVCVGLLLCFPVLLVLRPCKRNEEAVNVLSDISISITFFLVEELNCVCVCPCENECC